MDKDYETGYTKSGDIYARFWLARNAKPWDKIAELDGRCLVRFPNAELFEVKRTFYTDGTKPTNRVWWNILWRLPKG